MIIQIRRKLKAQSTLEYAFLITTVVAGLIAIDHYVKRGYQGRMKGAADELGRQYDTSAATDSTTETYKISSDKVEPNFNTDGTINYLGEPKSGQSVYTHTVQKGSETAKTTLGADFWPSRVDSGAHLNP